MVQISVQSVKKFIVGNEFFQKKLLQKIMIFAKNFQNNGIFPLLKVLDNYISSKELFFKFI